jgi:DnaJ-class molecular chaperone
MPHYKSEGCGDMIVTIKTTLPQLNPRQIELLKQMKASE